jgi:hypothetical protein
MAALAAANDGPAYGAEMETFATAVRGAALAG